MRNRVYILLLTVACFFGVERSEIRAQSPPLQQCVGGKAIFAVSGDLASTFRYSISGGGKLIDTSNIDSIVVQWGLEDGIQQIGVQEVNTAGCVGEWIFFTVDLRGTPFVLNEEQRYLQAGKPLELPIDKMLYKSIRSIPEINEQDPLPGVYKIVAEDRFGCKFTNTIHVIQNSSTPLKNP